MNNSTKKTVLCFGDSLTWGHICNGKRYSREERWTTMLSRLLGEDYYVIEEGLRSRTTNMDDPDQADRNGFPYFRACLESHEPVDYLVYFLGTNDTKTKFNRAAEEISAAAAKVLEWAKEYSGSRDFNLKIILVAPPLISLDYLKPNSSFDKTSNEKLTLAGPLYNKLAVENGYQFLDLSVDITGSPNDGIHLLIEDNRRIAASLAELIKTGQR